MVMLMVTRVEIELTGRADEVTNLSKHYVTDAIVVASANWIQFKCKLTLSSICSSYERIALSPAFLRA